MPRKLVMRRELRPPYITPTPDAPGIVVQFHRVRTGKLFRTAFNSWFIKQDERGANRNGTYERADFRPNMQVVAQCLEDLKPVDSGSELKWAV